MVQKILKYFIVQLKDAFNKAYIICLIIAFLLWALIKFSVIYQENIKVEVELKNIPENWIVTSLKKQTLTCAVRTTGFRLLLLSVTPNIEVDLNFEEMDLDSDSLHVFDIMDDNQDKLPDWLTKSEYYNFDNSKIKFELSKMKSKTFGIKPNIELEFKAGYLLDNLVLENDSIQVLIPERDFEKQNFIGTKSKVIKDIFQNEKIRLDLELPKYWKLEKGNHQIEAEIQVDQYTQGNFEMILDKDTVQNIQYFPSRVNIIYSVPSKKFNTINQSDFVVGIEPLSETENSSEALTVRIMKQPPFVKVLAIQPSEVEFLIFDNE